MCTTNAGVEENNIIDFVNFSEQFPSPGNGFFFEIVERRGVYAGYGAKNAPIRLAAQNEYQQSRDNVA